MAESKNQNSEPDSFLQDDIDDLLKNISREETAPDQNKREENNLLDDISPDDVNAFINSTLADISMDDLEADLLQSQNHDVDKPISSSQDTTDDVKEAIEVPKSEPEPGGDISQDDIDNMLAGNLDTAADDSKADSPTKTDTDTGDISQDDIEKLLAGNLDTDEDDSKAAPGTQTETDAGSDISQDDIDNLLTGESESDTSTATESDLSPPEEERSLYLSQNELDLLLEEYANDPPDFKASAEPQVSSLPEEENTEQSEATEILQNDIDTLLSSANDDANDEIVELEEGLISQEDIDSLLKGVDDETEPEEDTSSLISQEDIDLLLKGVDDDAPEEPVEKEESEVVLTDDGVSGLVSQEDIDALLRDDIDEEEAPVDQEPEIELDRVVLEEDDEPRADSEKDSSEPNKSKWYRSKLLIACSIGTIILMISSVSLYLFLTGAPEEMEEPEFASVEPIPIEEAAPVVTDVPIELSVDFNDFIVLAPLQREDVSYLKADVQVTCATETSAGKIVSQKPFFRFIIYDIFQKTLATLESPNIVKETSDEKQKNEPSKTDQAELPMIDQAKLKAAIRLSLEKALTEKGIKEIVLKNINLS